jgi:anti-sigma B factor antagonist
MGTGPDRLPAAHPRKSAPDVQRIIDRSLQVRVVKHNEDLHVCRVAGEIDLLTVSTLANVLDDLSKRRVRGVIVDLTDVTYCAAAGVRVLLDATARARWAGQRLAVVIANLTVARVLRATETAEGIENYASLSEAMLALTS